VRVGSTQSEGVDEGAESGEGRAKKDVPVSLKARSRGAVMFMEDNQRVTFTYTVSADVMWLLSV
jgi:hypothetical protein